MIPLTPPAGSNEVLPTVLAHQVPLALHGPHDVGRAATVRTGRVAWEVALLAMMAVCAPTGARTRKGQTEESIEFAGVYSGRFLLRHVLLRGRRSKPRTGDNNMCFRVARTSHVAGA